MSQLPSPGSLYQQMQGFGNAQMQELQQNYQNALGMANQQLASSGLLGTSIAPSIKMGYMKQYQLALNNLSQQLTQTKVGAGFQAIGAGQAQQSLGLQQQAQNAAQNNQAGYLALAQQQAGQQQQAGGGDTGYNWQPSGDVANMYAQAAGSSLFQS
jgi:hypothetical protein